MAFIDVGKAFATKDMALAQVRLEVCLTTPSSNLTNSSTVVYHLSSNPTTIVIAADYALG